MEEKRRAASLPLGDALSGYISKGGGESGKRGL